MDKLSVSKQLIAFLRPLGRRLRLRSSVELLMRSAWPALALCAVVLLVGRAWPVSDYRLAAGGVLAAWLVVWAAVSLFRPIEPFAVARRADGELGLHDRLATALVLSDPRRAAPAGFDRALLARQFDDALSAARSIDPRQAFPVRFRRGPLVRAGAALLAALALLALPNPMDAVVAEREQVAQTAKAEAARLEKLAQEIEQNAALDPEERQELLRQLRELAKQLRSNPGDAKQALADLARLQEQLRARLDPATPLEAAALEALAQQLAQLAGAKDKPESAAEAAELLEQLAAEMDKLSPQQREALAGALERAAAQTAGSNPGLAQALLAAAQAAREGASGQQAQRAAAQAAQAMQQSGEKQAWQQALARALSQAEASQRAVAQAGSRGQGQGQGQGQRQGQGQGPGQNQGPGQGQGQGSQPGGGGGTNANTLPPAVRTGQAGAPSGPNKRFVTGDINTVYSPLAAGQGRQEFVGGQQSENGQTTSEGKSSQPGAINPALVPYYEVYQQYMQIAGQAMERAYIPAGLQDYVRDYFSELEP